MRILIAPCLLLLLAVPASAETLTIKPNLYMISCKGAVTFDDCAEIDYKPPAPIAIELSQCSHGKNGDFCSGTSSLTVSHDGIQFDAAIEVEKLQYDKGYQTYSMTVTLSSPSGGSTSLWIDLKEDGKLTTMVQTLAPAVAHGAEKYSAVFGIDP